MWAKYINEKSVEIFEVEPSGTEDQVFKFIAGEEPKYATEVTYHIEGDTIVERFQSNTVSIQSIKDTLKNSIDALAYGLLENSDWKVIKHLEIGEALPQQDADYRSDVRDKANETQQLVNAMETLEQLSSFNLDNIEWPLDPNIEVVDKENKI